MSLLGAVLAMILYWISQTVPTPFLQQSWYLHPPLSVDEARAALTTIAETTIGVIGVVFSITLVPLTIASSQYGSIIMRSFMRDRATQLVLGAYGTTTFYSMVLVAIIPTTTALLNPGWPVAAAFYMLLLNLVILFYFIHHVADSLQAATVIEEISNELEEVIKKDRSLAKETDTSDPRQDEANLARDNILREGRAVASTGEGYVRAIDYGKLMHIAVKCKCVLYLSRQSGDFVSRGDQLLLARPPLNKSSTSTASGAYLLGRNRTLYQDPEYGIYNLVTIAVRALSHAINDPVTPVMCLNRIGSSLGMLAERVNPSPYFCDKDNQLRIVCNPVSFERLVGVAFNMIREYGRGNAEVLMKMLETIKRVTLHAKSNDQRKVLLKHATLIERDSRIGLASEYDQQRVREIYDETLKTIGLIDPN